MFRRIDGVYRSLSGNMPRIAKEDIGAIIRQAIFLSKTSKRVEAEKLLIQATQRYPGEADLFGVLGRIYKLWTPPRITDARECFRRAWQLKCFKPEMYDIWCDMELSEQEWTKAADAAEKGLKILGDNKKLLYIAGYARSRLARELLRSLQQEKALKELYEASRLLEKALSIEITFDYRERALNALTYRALILTYESLGDTRKLDYLFKSWFGEHPDDANVYSEWERISRRMSLTITPPKNQ